MADLGNAYVNIVPRAPDIKKELAKILGDNMPSGDPAGDKTGKSFLSGLKRVVSVAAVGSVIKSAFTAGGDLEQSFGGLDTLYGDAAAGAKEYAMAAAQAGINANSFAEQAVSFGAALKKAYGGDTTAAMEAANVAILDMADNAAKMGTPIESIQQAYQGFARGQYTLLDNLKLGYGGTQEEMQRLLTDAQALTGVEYNIDNLGDVYNAIHVIQEDLGLTGVAADEAKTTLVGSFNAVKASWTNTLAALTTGEGLDAAMANLSESVGNFANNILGMLGQLAPQVPFFLRGIVDALIANAPSLAVGAIEMAAQLLAALVSSIPTIITFIPELFIAVGTAVEGIDWGALGMNIIQGIANGLMAAGGLLWDTMLSLFNTTIEGIKAFLGISSPSKRFAREIGHWIPPGIGMGAEDNIRALDAPLGRVASHGLAVMRRATAPGMTVVGTSALDLDRLLDYEQARPVEVTVVLQGDAKEVFKVVKTYNTVRTKATNYNALAARR